VSNERDFAELREAWRRFDHFDEMSFGLLTLFRVVHAIAFYFLIQPFAIFTSGWALSVGASKGMNSAVFLGGQGGYSVVKLLDERRPTSTDRPAVEGCSHLCWGRVSSHIVGSGLMTTDG
jgi:hypothetical protein